MTPTTYKVFFTNHGYPAPLAFPSQQDAIAYAKSIGFEATIIKTPPGHWLFESGQPVAAWSPISGERSL